MTLLEYAVPTDYGAKVTVKLEGVPLGKVVCYGGADLLDLEPGQTVAAQVKFQDSARLREDTITNFTAQGVFLLAYQRGDEAVYGEGSAGSPRWWPAHAARAMQNRVTALFDGDEAAFLSAILTGGHVRIVGRSPGPTCRRRDSATSWPCPGCTAAF